MTDKAYTKATPQRTSGDAYGSTNHADATPMQISSTSLSKRRRLSPDAPIPPRLPAVCPICSLCLLDGHPPGTTCCESCARTGGSRHESCTAHVRHLRRNPGLRHAHASMPVHAAPDTPPPPRRESTTDPIYADTPPRADRDSDDRDSDSEPMPTTATQDVCRSARLRKNRARVPQTGEPSTGNTARRRSSAAGQRPSQPSTRPRNDSPNTGNPSTRRPENGNPHAPGAEPSEPEPEPHNGNDGSDEPADGDTEHPQPRAPATGPEQPEPTPLRPNRRTLRASTIAQRQPDSAPGAPTLRASTVNRRRLPQINRPEHNRPDTTKPD